MSRLTKMKIRTILCIIAGLFSGAAVSASQPAADSCRTAPACWYVDSTAVAGSAYGSFADIWQTLPGGLFFDRGSVGQPASGILGSGSPSSLCFSFEGLSLTDPLSGGVDLNLLPVESIHTIGFFRDPLSVESGYWPTAQTVNVGVRDLAFSPIRSRVAYRTGGRSYNDVDVRFGMRPSAKLSLNFGGVDKSYHGTTGANERYRAQKAHIQIRRELGRKWRAQYFLLRNRHELNQPLFSPPPDFPHPHVHEQQARYDHGVMLSRADQFSAMLQLTDLHREWYYNAPAQPKWIADGTRFNARLAWQKKIAILHWQTGGQYQWSRLESKVWGDHRAAEGGGWSQLHVVLGARAAATAGLRLLSLASGWYALPYGQIRIAPSPAWRWLIWGEGWRSAAPLLARFGSGPFFTGQADLRDEQTHSAGVTMDGRFAHARLLVSASWTDSRNAILAEMKTGDQIPIYRNQPRLQRAALDAHGEWQMLSWLDVTVNGKYLWYDGRQPANWPTFSASGYLQVHRILFKGDLNARLRLGAKAIGERFGPVPFYASEADGRISLPAVAAPYLQAIFIIKDVTLFFALENPLSESYQRLYAYPMPKNLLRWGFVWNFLN